MYFTERNALESIKEGALKIKEEPSKILSGNKFQDRHCVLRDGYLILYKDLKVFAYVVFDYVHVSVWVFTFLSYTFLSPLSWKSRPIVNKIKCRVSWRFLSAAALAINAPRSAVKTLNVAFMSTSHFLGQGDDLSPKEKSYMCYFNEHISQHLSQ